jgi:cytochrome c biogenesis protein CcmG/thiol:disulfide interchange protein DsbE
MPDMEVVQSTFKGKKFQMVPISLDLDSDLVSSFYREHNLTMPAYLDPGQNVASRYNITGVPETFLIDTEGTVVRRYIGQHPWASTQMLAQLEKLIP